LDEETVITTDGTVDAAWSFFVVALSGKVVHQAEDDLTGCSGLF
jgi:hypothetical protein